jgi:hypothetical protein
VPIQPNNRRPRNLDHRPADYQGERSRGISSAALSHNPNL